MKKKSWFGGTIKWTHFVKKWNPKLGRQRRQNEIQDTEEWSPQRDERLEDRGAGSTYSHCVISQWQVGAGPCCCSVGPQNSWTLNWRGSPLSQWTDRRLSTQSRGVLESYKNNANWKKDWNANGTGKENVHFWNISMKSAEPKTYEHMYIQYLLKIQLQMIRTSRNWKNGHVYICWCNNVWEHNVPDGGLTRNGSKGRLIKDLLI